MIKTLQLTTPPPGQDRQAAQSRWGVSIFKWNILHILLYKTIQVLFSLGFTIILFDFSIRGLPAGLCWRPQVLGNQWEFHGILLPGQKEFQSESNLCERNRPSWVPFHIFWLQDKFLSRREAILGEVAKNNEVAEEEEVSVPVDIPHYIFWILDLSESVFEHTIFNQDKYFGEGSFLPCQNISEH